MAEVLHCEKRNETGTLRMRRLRKSGKVPAVLYSRGDNVKLSIDSRDIVTLIRHTNPIVELKGAVSESAIIKDIQWDPLGVDVLHLDLARIDATESVEVTIHIELVGVAPGTKSGGVLKLLMHEVDILCPATAVPDKLELRINDLELDGALTAGQIRLPASASLIGSPDEIVVQCVEVTAVEEIEIPEGEVAEPEVIGRKADDEEGEGTA